MPAIGDHCFVNNPMNSTLQDGQLFIIRNVEASTITIELRGGSQHGATMAVDDSTFHYFNCPDKSDFTRVISYQKLVPGARLTLMEDGLINW